MAAIGSQRSLQAFVLGGFLAAISFLHTPALAQSSGVSSASDAKVQADISKELDKKQFRNVTVMVQGGHVVLTGTVDRYADKLDAERRAHLKNRNDIQGFEDNIQVAGPTVEDSTLGQKLAEKLFYDREGYGTLAFNAFTLSVQNGVVTLGGVAFGPPDHDSAVDLVANYPGVKGVIDHIQVAPLSPNDNRIRLAEERSIYGYPALNKYAVNPGRPIRIAVINGIVTLSGEVDSQGDKDMANIRANQVSGVFKVTNNLQVAGSSSSESQR